MAKKTSKFTIDDAFDESLDDVVVRVYGSTTIEKSPFNERVKAMSNEAMTNVRVDRPAVTSLASSNGMHPHPALLSIRTGIMSDDVRIYFTKRYGQWVTSWSLGYSSADGFERQRLTDTWKLSVLSVILWSWQGLVETPPSSGELESCCGSICIGCYGIR